jgi:ABC-2 type transport system permease protein
VPFAIVYYVLSRSFIRIVTARNAAKKQKYEATALKGSSVVWSMTKKDLTRFFSSPPYMTNAGLGLLYSIGLTIFAMVSGDSVIRNILEKTDRFSDPGAYTTVIAAFVISFFAALTTISGCSVSVEGKNLWILKSMPVRAKDVLTGKLLSHLVLAIPVSVLCSILYLFVARILTVPGVILMFLMPIAFNCFNALFGLISNLHFGKLDYPSIAKAAKSTTSSLIPILATILLVIGSAVLYFTALHGKIDVTVYGIIVTAVIFAVDLCMFSYLGSTGAQKRWDELGQ